MVLDRRMDVRCSGQVGARKATSVRRSSSADVDGQEGYGQEDRHKIVCAYSKIVKMPGRGDLYMSTPREIYSKEVVFGVQIAKWKWFQ
jgi:hypothetical protein